MVHLYGIANCDSMKKARNWLEQQQIDYRFHDYRKDGLEPLQLDAWIDELGWQALVNRRSTTWRKLSERQREQMDQASARRIMLASPTLIKRPLLDLGDRRVLGFTESQYAHIFA
jgi:arsenate reductase